MVIAWLIVALFYLMLGLVLCITVGYPLYNALIFAAIFTCVTIIAVTYLNDFFDNDEDEENKEDEKMNEK